MGKHQKSNVNLITAIRVSCIKRLIYPILSIAFICFLFYKIPFADILTPKTVSDFTMLSSDSGNDIEYFKISSDGWLYSGYDNYKDTEISQYIFYNIVNDNCYYLFVSPKYVDISDMTLKGTSVNVSVTQRTEAFNGFLRDFSNDINWNFDALNEISSNVVFTTVSYNTTFFKILLVALVITITTLFIFVAYMLFICAFPLLSPQLGCKHRHSPERIKSRSEFAKLLQTELDNNIFNDSSLYITNKYIISAGKDELCVIPLSKLCFIFEHGNLHKFLWFYMKVSHTIYFLCSNSLKCNIVHKNSSNIDQIMQILREIVPDLMVGYSIENQAKYLEIVKANKQ